MLHELFHWYKPYNRDAAPNDWYNQNLYTKNDERIKAVLEEFAENLSIGISNLINIFEPEVIGIGGSFVYFEEFLLDKIKEKIISGNLLFNKRDDIIIKSAILANDAGIIGASML